MLGLKIIRESLEITLAHLSEKLGVSKQNVWKWEQAERKIPDGHLDTLAELFNVDKNILQQEHSKLDELKLQAVLLNRKIKNSEREVEMTDYDNDGNEITFSKVIIDSHLVEELAEIKVLIEKENALSKVQAIIDGNTTEGGETTSSDNPAMETYVQFFIRFADVVAAVNNEKIPLIFKVLEALEQSLAISRNGVFGKGRNAGGKINKNDELVVKLLALLNEHEKEHSNAKETKN